MTEDESHARAEKLWRAHWESKGFDPDEMAPLDGLADTERTLVDRGCGSRRLG